MRKSELKWDLMSKAGGWNHQVMRKQIEWMLHILLRNLAGREGRWKNSSRELKVGKETQNYLHTDSFPGTLGEYFQLQTLSYNWFACLTRGSTDAEVEGGSFVTIPGDKITSRLQPITPWPHSTLVLKAQCGTFQDSFRSWQEICRRQELLTLGMLLSEPHGFSTAMHARACLGPPTLSYIYKHLNINIQEHRCLCTKSV